jgi:hypothetical protein
MEIVQIDKANIKSIARFIELNKNLGDDLATCFKGIVSRQQVSDDWIKSIIIYDATIKAIIIDCQKNLITSVAFSGALNITYTDLTGLFDKSDQYYERYDDTMNFFFKDANVNSYMVKCFMLDDDMKKDNWENEKLGNISIHLA